jgi:hypothetical protein
MSDEPTPIPAAEPSPEPSRDPQGRFAPQDPESDPAPEPDTSRTYTYDDIKDVREEAKKYRHRLRDAQEARAALQGRVDAHDRGAVERLAGEHLNESSDIWLVHDIADFRADDGSLDEKKVAEAIAAIGESRPHWISPRADWGGGYRGPSVSASSPSFGQALKAAVGDWSEAGVNYSGLRDSKMRGRETND